ncbi:diacylglycerol kinase family lipid kinase [Akkermansiaceae bacterium]|nr:diacylglycerol kinase family lipid kinase [Akkermansiaceae bacterium]
MSLPRRYPLIFNPRARSQKGGKARQFLMEHANRFALYATNTGQEAVDLARKFADDGEPVVIAAGGDGTLNAVVSGLAGSRTALGVMPAGTMNVFARELGIPSNSLPKAFEVIEKGLIREVDLFSANGAPFVQMAGVGFDAKVIEETTWESKKMLGPLAYLLAAVKVLGEKPPKVEVTTAEGRRETGVAVLCGNGSLYGGQFRLFRKADNTDSMLDVIVFKEAGYRFVLDSLAGIARGGIDLADSTAYFQSSGITVTSDREVPVEIDGEWLGRYRQVEFRETDSRLRVLAPEVACGTPFMDTMRSILQWPSKPLEKPLPQTP